MEELCVHLKSPKTLALLVAAGTAVVLLVARRRRSRSQGPRVVNYQKDVVHFFGFPSSRTIVTVSPFAFKLETWLRMKGIRYVAHRKPHTWSRKGQIPFVELNGEEYNESNLIIAKLTQHFGANDELTEEQQGLVRGLEVMLDNQTFFSCMYYRFVEAISQHIRTWEYLSWPVRQFLIISMPRFWRKRCSYHGIGRNTVPEIYAMGCDDILALSRVLGSKPYLMGNRMTTVDCYAFGHLAQVLYNTIEYPHKQFMRERTPNLCNYVGRIKQELWPDWDKLCAENLYGSKET